MLRDGMQAEELQAGPPRGWGTAPEKRVLIIATGAALVFKLYIHC